MHIKTIASAIALATSLGLAGAVYAQAPITVNGLTVSEVDLPTVQAYCEQLQAGMPADSEDSGSATPSKDEDSNNNATENDESAPTLDLGQVTLEGCIEAGLISETAN
jgi:hypothetical protein